ncbi:hypothetical protein EYC80_002422 [Monilinia laxa]|uniref:Uncharacterized protein n=1 Tax=Monilinia laxa TaxID=61186 RepID=A0A5N6K4G8_MONLA|nr:hypothetical protein EYC80_002422 [Monilinia laxa]
MHQNYITPINLPTSLPSYQPQPTNQPKTHPPHPNNQTTTKTIFITSSHIKLHILSTTTTTTTTKCQSQSQSNIRKKINSKNSIHKILHLGTVFLLSLHPSIRPRAFIHTTSNHTHITPYHFIYPSQLILHEYEYEYEHLSMEIPLLLNSLSSRKTECPESTVFIPFDTLLPIPQKTPKKICPDPNQFE